MIKYRLISQLIITIILSCCFSACTNEIEEYFAQDGSIRLTSSILPTSRVTDQSLQSTQIVEGQQVGITITGANTAHENVVWLVGKAGSLTNTGSNVYWDTTDITIMAYHPYHANWTENNYTFSVNTDQSTDDGYLNSDLLWAKTTSSPSNNPTELSFSHKLSKINVTLINDGNEDMSNATITICGTNISTGFNTQTGELYSVTKNIADIKASVTTENSYTASAIIVPQTIEQGTKFIRINLGDVDYHYTLSEDHVFESGQVYHFTLEVNISDNSKAKTDYIDMKFDLPGTTTNYNETNGTLTVTYPTDNIPNVKQGKAIVLPEKYNFAIRVVENVSISGNTLTVRTSEGNMANLFRNTNFTLTTDPSLASRAAGSNIYTPKAYGYIDENGKYKEIYNEIKDTRAIYPLDVNFWTFDTNFNNDKIYEGKAGKLSWDKCEFMGGLKGTFTFDFGEKKLDEVNAVGDLKKVDCKFTGSLSMDMLLHYNYVYEYEENGDTILKYNILPTGVFNFQVPVGPAIVPVTLLVYTHLGRQYACQIEGALDITTGVKMGGEISLGMVWNQETGAQPIKEFIPSFDFHPFTIEAQASAEAKVSYYPQIEIGIYNFKAIWVEPRPYLKEKLEAGLRTSTDDNNYIGWKSRAYCGMDVRMGLEAEFGLWRKDIWKSDIYNILKDQLFFEAPKQIRTLSPENNINVKKNEKVTAEFIIESYSPITKQYYPCPGALVYFYSEHGKMDKTIAVADLEGKVSVVWIPDSDNSASLKSRADKIIERSLTATVVDKEGEFIDGTVLIAQINETNDPLKDALVKLYESTNGNNWINNDNWCSELPIDQWYGISIYEDEYSIILDNNNLVGKIDQTFPENLTYFCCSNNQLTSLNITNCKTITDLDCTANQLTSLNIANCTSLSNLYCSQNPLTNIDITNCYELTKLNLNNGHINSLQIIGGNCLTYLDCSKNQLTFLDLSSCTSLEQLNCSNNQLSSMDLSSCTKLKALGCWENKLTSLNLANCNDLQYLDCPKNRLMSLNVSGLTSLEYLYCNDNQLTSLNVLGCVALQELNCSMNKFNSLNVSGCSSLTTFEFDENPLTTLNVSGCNRLNGIDLVNISSESLHVTGGVSLQSIYYRDIQLGTLNVSECPALESLVSGGNNQVSTLNVSNCKSLNNINCTDDGLKLLDVSGCTALRHLDCGNNQLGSLNLAECTSLAFLSCSNNELTSLELNGFESLLNLSCYRNQLKSLDVSDCISLYSLSYSHNPLTYLDVTNCVNLTQLSIDELESTTIKIKGENSFEELKYEEENKKFTYLDLSGCTSLQEFNCENGQLSHLDVSGCTALEWLYCANNQLTSLNVSGCVSLKFLECQNNKITSVIPDSFSQLNMFNHDERYRYWTVVVPNGDGGYDYITKHEDRGIGWWYTGEPSKGYHGPN